MNLFIMSIFFSISHIPNLIPGHKKLYNSMHNYLNFIQHGEQNLW